MDRSRERVDGLPPWPTLIGRAVEDLSSIVHAEVRLLELGVKNTVQQEIDRAIMAALALATLLLGFGCLTAAAILCLHEALRAPWWIAFAIVGGVALVGGVGIWIWSGARSPRTAYSTYARAAREVASAGPTASNEQAEIREQNFARVER
jgi:hypothetical protein